ncbi:phage portal protein [Microbacterium resistens]|uniref:Phage portal protein n=1 Tax=Microbacterium resistens TaxID=156977 RepID=A0ABY3RQY5_9MICO|nr:phage portal protein [Microbacterium resistens]UGS26331.1 phage portal protein [Microbacterium resistens]
MGFRDGLNALLGRSGGQYIEWLGPTFRQMILGLTPEELYRTQPHLRIVLSFVARNVAHLGLGTFARVSDTDRVRLRDDPLALLLKYPNASMTQYELLEALASDMGLYDVAYWAVYEDPDRPSGWTIQPIPPAWVVEQRGGTFFAAGKFVVQNPDGTRTEVPADNMLVFHGWNPGRPKHGTSPVETLKQVLAEQVQAWSYREQVWQRGGRVGAYITRPKDAVWSDAARERFARDWKERWTGADGKKAGGTPILEDGMTLNRLGFSAREDEWSEVAKLALATVAAVYHVNPVMVGILDNANFSNTKEFRKMLYSETLGPTLARIEDRINTFLVPRVAKTNGAYSEFNIQEKLQGDFEEQAAVISTSVGRPWMTADEARAKFNMPALGGDAEKLVVPLNVLIGGQASPRDSAPPKALDDIGELRVVRALPARKSGQWKVRAKSQVTQPQSQKAEQVIAAFFERQRKTVLSALGAKAAGEWWDAERWDRELGDDLFALAVSVSSVIGKDVAASMGFSESDYDVARTEAFLREVAKSRAGAINSTTRAQIEAVLDGDGPEGVDDPAHVFDVAEESRKGVIAGTLLTTVAAFATVEAARQNGGASKTWLVTSGNPRPEHAAMNGETVGLDDLFSNGAKWPGDPVLGADGVAGCTCDVEVTFG